MNANRLKYNFDDHTLEGFVNSCIRGFKVKQITDDLLRVDLYTFDRQRDTFWDGADPIHSFLLETPAGECIEEQFWAIFCIVEDYRNELEEQPAPANPIQLMVEHQREIRRSISTARRSDRLRLLAAERLGTRDMRAFRSWALSRLGDPHELSRNREGVI